MQEDESANIQQIADDKWMLRSTDEYVIEQYTTFCHAEGKTDLEKCGIFDTRKQVEEILSRIRPRPFLLGQDPHNRFFKKYGTEKVI